MDQVPILLEGLLKKQETGDSTNQEVDMQKLLTVVVPVFKVESYINKCLDSLLAAPDWMGKLEVVIVNDGTPDNSAEMSREYVKRYPESFRQIDKENGGHGSAWNVGLKEATGKYLRFLDSDDWFTNLDRLMEDLDKCEADIVFNPFVKEYAYENRFETVNPLPVMGETSIDAASWGAPQWGGYNNFNFWSTTYKTEILRPLHPLFAEKAMFDDFIITWAPLVYGRTYISLDYPVYHYLLGRPGQSMSVTQQRKSALSYLKCFGQYETTRSRIDERLVPADLLDRIDDAITGYAGLIFASMIYLPLKESLGTMAYLWKNYIADNPTKSKLQKRYAAMPGVVFYYVEHLRRKIKRI